MITLDKAKQIVQKQHPEFPIYNITDIGDKWAFSYDTPIPGIPFVCVDKATGGVSTMPVPPIENLDIIEKGTLLYSIEDD